MSFSYEVKDALVSDRGENKEVRKSELKSFFHMAGIRKNDNLIVFSSENILVAKRIIILLNEFFYGKYSFKVQCRGNFKKVFYLVNLYSSDDSFFDLEGFKNKKEEGAFLKGAFLAKGSLTDPKKCYHMELRCRSFMIYIVLRDLLSSFDIDAKGINRKGIFFLYLKDGELISDFLKVIGAFNFMFAFEETRVIKEIKNMANRRNNCDLANLDKIIKSSLKQIKIIKSIGIGNLPINLREIGTLRVENPELSLVELGRFMSPPIKKSATNYRLKKIESLGDR